MRRWWRLVTPAALLLAFWGLLLVWAMVQRFANAEVRLVIDNRTDAARVFRAFDGPTDALVATFRVDPGARTVLRHRPSAWWRDLSGEERARGREEGMRVEFVTVACDLLATETVTHWEGRLTLSPDVGGLSHEGVVSPAPKLRQVNASSVTVGDPCAGRAPRPVALVRNLEPTAVVLGGRLLLEACSTRIVAPGDLAAVLPASATHGARPINVPSIEVQRARWPLETLTVTVSLQAGDTGAPEDVVDEWPSNALSDGDRSEECPTVREVAARP